MPYFRKVGPVLFIAWLVIGPIARAEETIRVGTFNCEFLIRRTIHVKYGLPLRRIDWKPADRDQWDQDGFRESKFRDAARAVAKAIAALDVEVLTLNEVGDEQDVATLYSEVQLLGKEFPHRAVGKTADTSTWQNVAVFSKLPLTEVTSPIPGRELYDSELDDPEAEDETGVSKGMHVVFQANGKPVHYYALHFKSEAGGHEADAQRIAQASIVRRHYLPFLNNGEHVLVTGDLNDGPGQPAIERIRGKDDLFGDLLHTWHARYFDQNDLESRYSYRFQGMPNQIDHILPSISIRDACKRSGGIKTKVIPVTATIEGTAQLASDHRSVVVTFEFE